MGIPITAGLPPNIPILSFKMKPKSAERHLGGHGTTAKKEIRSLFFGTTTLP